MSTVLPSVPLVAYVYWSAHTSTPRARARSMSWMAAPLAPQKLSPFTLMCDATTVAPVRSPISIVSRTASSSVGGPAESWLGQYHMGSSPSARSCEM
jgi:hypothetical protein